MENSTLNVEEMLLAIRQTQKALKRGDALLSKVARAGLRVPDVLASMVEPTLKLQAAMRTELIELERAFDEAMRGED
ncbi:MULTISPECIES: hypothetical protein [unclassified Mesorhizobium]|uniref:hypothetical protein n=1 Tax=unclassified Mesorhizobium TaxID=325217 RepID=UPI00112BA02D|nr:MULTISPECIES: hypothetical protein [unclassified Mesorhizobium]MBZ9703258.1 hypothetical protein [Mesorhizobium sp. CO1-1-3]MBZ9947109.1 hypothetical protein [Mesorhizobium sp. BR1-1-11]TPJ06668.1 hypothetical protein FJ428_10660 [Mesorhizobium sp. B2-8-1]